MKKKLQFKKTMTLEEILTLDPNTADILLSFGLHCLGCPCSRAETLEEASMVHGIDVNEIIEKLNNR